MFTGEEVQTVSLETASALTRQFRENHSNERKGGYFSRKTLQDLLEQSNCVGARIYYANENTGQMTMVMVGVTSDENDIVGNGALIFDRCIPCPDRCAIDSPLNGNT
jgi:hypothetical protein